GAILASGALRMAAQSGSQPVFIKSLVRLAVIPWIAVLLLSAQAGDVRARMSPLLRYTGVENPAPAEVARMAELWTKVQQPGLSADERRTTLRDMVLVLPAARARPRGPPSGA